MMCWRKYTSEKTGVVISVNQHENKIQVTQVTRRSLAESDDTRGCICTICIVDLLMMSGLRSKRRGIYFI